MLAIAGLLAVNENDHMLPYPALVVEHIAASLRIGAKILVQHLAQCFTRYLARGTRNMPLDISGESHRGHIAKGTDPSSYLCRGGL